MTEPVRILYRPVGPKELALIVESGHREFPPRLPEQPIFYPVTNEDYARHIAEQWNVKESGARYVTRFAVREEFIRRYPVQQVGARVCAALCRTADPANITNAVGVNFALAASGVCSRTNQPELKKQAFSVGKKLIDIKVRDINTHEAGLDVLTSCVRDQAIAMRAALTKDRDATFAKTAAERIK